MAAACEGMISLFEQDVRGRLALVRHGQSGVAPSLEAFQQALLRAEATRRLRQLVLVGSGNDLAWMHVSLPVEVSKHITAEIEYPLVSAWFLQPLPLDNLAQALERVLH